ncbi:MAG: copper homeostasis membrane protein CopD [Hyphomicrobium sp.]
MIDVATALIGVRAATIASAVIVFGVAAFLALLATPDLAGKLHRRLEQISAIAVILLVSSAALMLPVQAAMIGDGWGDALNLELMRDIIAATDTGRIAAFRVAIAGAMLAGVLLRPGIHAARHRVLMVLAALFVVSFAGSGHAAMHAGLLGIAHRVNHAIHVLAGAFWLGMLIPLFLTARCLADAASRSGAASVLARFSAAGAAAVVLVVGTGAINTALILGRWPVDWSSPYQEFLTFKIIAVIGMLALAAINRTWLVPRAGAAEGHRALCYSIAAEIALGAVVLVLVAAFATFEPI